MKNYLLIISCSARKVSTPEPLSALERYDGPAYRCLRKARREGRVPKNLNVLIVSAKYGLIACKLPVDCYDQRMTPDRAAALRYPIQRILKSFLTIRDYEEIFINLGKTYMQTLEDFDWGPHSTVEATGGIGQRTAQMKAWLYQIYQEENVTNPEI